MRGTPSTTDDTASITVTPDVTDRIGAQPVRRSLMLGILDAEEPPAPAGPTGAAFPSSRRMNQHAITTVITCDLIGTDPELDRHLRDIAHALPAPLQAMAGSDLLAGTLDGLLTHEIGVFGSKNDDRWTAASRRPAQPRIATQAAPSPNPSRPP